MGDNMKVNLAWNARIDLAEDTGVTLAWRASLLI